MKRGKKEKEKTQPSPPSIFSFLHQLFFLLLFFTIIKHPRAPATATTRAARKASLSSRPGPIPTSSPSSSLAFPAHGLDRRDEPAASEALAELLGLGLRDPGDDDGGAVVVGLLHDLWGNREG